MPYGGKSWTYDDDTRLRAMLKAGMLHAQIGVELGRTDKSVKARVRRMELQGANKPTVKVDKPIDLGGKVWASAAARASAQYHEAMQRFYAKRDGIILARRCPTQMLIDQLDGISRQRALTDRESDQLERAIRKLEPATRTVEVEPVVVAPKAPPVAINTGHMRAEERDRIVALFKSGKPIDEVRRFYPRSDKSLRFLRQVAKTELAA